MSATVPRPSSRPPLAADHHPPRLRVAIVLHGRMGGLNSLMAGMPPRATRSYDNAHPSVASAALCAASLERHFVAPNRRLNVETEVFGHSWSPEIGAALDTLFAPRRSLHERGVQLNRFQCPLKGFAHAYCHRTVSHLLGITRAMRLKAAEERATGNTYDAVFLSRWDIMWQTPLVVLHAGLPGWQGRRERRAKTFWLPRICVAPGPQGDVGLGNRLRGQACGGGASPWLATQAAHQCSGLARACQSDMTAEARELYVMDWWLLIGTSRDADDFAEQLSERFVEHGERVLARLSVRKSGAVAMGHAWFGAQLIWAMNATLRHAGNIGVDFHLGRAWSEIDCLATKERACERPTCRASDFRAPLASVWPHHTHHAPKSTAAVGGGGNRSAESTPSPLPPLVTVPDPASQMAGSCEQRFFICKRGSRACGEEEARAPPMDQSRRKALFLGCAERLCAPPVSVEAAADAPSNAAPANSSACGQAMLSLWLHVSESGGGGGGGGGGAGKLERVEAMALAALRSRANGALPRLDDVCADAWKRSDGGMRYPSFRNISSIAPRMS